MKSSDPALRFTDRVEAYVRYRPDYPADAIQWMLQQAGLDRPGVIADIGSGTGISTRPLLERGHQVFAIEPNDAMRAYAERTLSSFEGFVSVDAAAEATTLDDQSIDLITAGQAFHWFKKDATRAEFARVLRPGGQVALLWNDRITEGDPFHVAYEGLLKEHATDYERVNHQNLAESDFTRFYLGGYEFATFDNAQALDLEGLIGRVQSSSYMPGPEHPNCAAMTEALRVLFDRYAVNDAVTIKYQTTVRVGRVS
jgi:SAM-dependent methyltransferase